MFPMLTIWPPPCLVRGDFSSIFLSAAPISEFLHLEHTPVSPFDGVDGGDAQTFPRSSNILPPQAPTRCTERPPVAAARVVQ